MEPPKNSVDDIEKQLSSIMTTLKNIKSNKKQSSSNIKQDKNKNKNRNLDENSKDSYIGDGEGEEN